MNTPFPSRWPVATDADLKDFTVILPRLTWWQRLKDELHVEDPTPVQPPEYLRLHMRRKGFRGKFGPRYVFRVDVNLGGNNAELTVAEDLAPSCPPHEERIDVTEATKGTFSRGKFRRQSGALTGIVAVPVGGAIAALGTLATLAPAAPALIIGGAAVAGVGAIAAGVAALKARD